MGLGTQVWIGAFEGRALDPQGANFPLGTDVLQGDIRVRVRVKINVRTT